MTRHIRDVHARDIVENTDPNDVLDFQRDAGVVVLRNARGTKVVLHVDDSIGAAEMRATPQGGTTYELMLGPEVPFSVLIALMEHL